MKLFQKSLLVMIFFCFFSIVTFSQNKLIDSLKNELKKELTNTQRAKVLGDLTWYNRTISIDSSLKYGNKALTLLEKIDDKKMLSQQLSDMAAVYLHKGELFKSKDFYLKALKIRKTLKDTIGVAKIKGNLAAFYQRQQKLDSAMIYSIEAMRIFEQKGIKNIATRIKSNIASMYIDLKAYNKSLIYLQEVLEFQTISEDYFYKSNTLSNMGNAYLFKADTTLAIKHYELAIDFAKMSNNNQTQGVALANLGNIYSLKNDSEKAIFYLNESHKIRKKLNLDFDLASTNFSLGLEYLRNGNYKKAKKKFLECKAYFEEKEINDKLISLYSNLTLVYAYEKNIKLVNYYSDKYTKLNSLYISENQSDKILELETKYQTEKKEKEIAKQKEELLEQELAIKNRNLYAILLVSALIILAIIFFSIYKRNQLKRKQLQKEINLKDALSVIKTQNKLQEQRLRISRDLHDNIGSQLTFIISSIDNLKYISKDANQKLKDKLSGISSFTSETISQLRDTIWAMNKNEITIEDLHARILSFVEKAKTATEVIQFEVNQNSKNYFALSSIKGMNIFRVIQEAINNTIKYANASKITISINDEKDNLSIIINDNGNGFDKKTIELGNGLSNMEKRMSEVDGKVKIESKVGTGTNIRIICKL